MKNTLLAITPYYNNYTQIGIEMMLPLLPRTLITLLPLPLL